MQQTNLLARLRYPAAVRRYFPASRRHCVRWASLAFDSIVRKKGDNIVNGAVRGDYHATGEPDALRWRAVSTDADSHVAA